MRTLLKRFMRARTIKHFGRDEGGATAIEYGLIVSLVFLAVVAAVNNFSAKTNTMYSNISSNLSSP